MPKPKKKRVAVSLTNFFIDGMDRLVAKGLYNEYQDIIRQALRDLFEKHK
ncbi:hypothetical protein ES703_105119 [subsurface metagenome]